MKNFKVIILPPDTHQFTIRDRLCDENSFFNEIVNFFCKKKKFNKKILIKYRSKAQKNKFPNNFIEHAEQGKLLDFCNENTSVIGPVNSATIECLTSKIDYFCYRYDPELNKNLAHTYTLDKMLHVANNIGDIERNFEEKKIFKDNFTKNDLVHTNGLKLNKIIEEILNKFIK